VLYSANLAGVACARSLHFQFLVWYFHSLPLLLRCARLPWPAHVAFVVALELCWGQHPPQPWSSACITALHLLLLILLFARAAGRRQLALGGPGTQVKAAPTGAGGFWRLLLATPADPILASTPASGSMHEASL